MNNKKNFFSKNKIARIFIGGVTLFLFGCNLSSENEKTPIGRVNDKYLFYEDVQNSIPKGLSAEDSILTLKRIIDSWIRETLVIQKAEENLTEEQKLEWSFYKNKERNNDE